jgi:hypothetical protein
LAGAPFIARQATGPKRDTCTFCGWCELEPRWSCLVLAPNCSSNDELIAIHHIEPRTRFELDNYISRCNNRDTKTTTLIKKEEKGKSKGPMAQSAFSPMRWLCGLLLLVSAANALKFDLIAHTGGESLKKERCIRNFVGSDTLVVVTSTVDGYKGDGMLVNIPVCLWRGLE